MNSKTTSASVNAKKMTMTALLAALALIFSYIEVLIPFSPGIPGIKLGIANLVIIISLYGSLTLNFQLHKSNILK